MPRPAPPTFASFVAVPENRSALAAVREVAEALAVEQAAPASPVYVHGPAGAGKSHLVAALAEHVARHSPHRAIVLVTAGEREPFITNGAEGDDDTAGHSVAADLLVVEDLQRLPARHAA